MEEVMPKRLGCGTAKEEMSQIPQRAIPRKTPSAGSGSPPPWLPASESLQHTIFGTTSSIFDLWSRPLGVARLSSLHGVLPRPHPSEGVG